MKESIGLSKESKEKISSEIVLHFFRHSIKEKTNNPDDLIPISQEGRKLAKEKSFKNVNLDQSVAFGSPKIRTQETAMLMMAGELDDITGDETLEELKEKINGGVSFGSKIGIDKRLDYEDDFESPLGKKAYVAYNNNKYLSFLANESDMISKKTNDKTKSNYSAKSSQLAKVIHKYIKIIPRWNKLVSEKSGKYDSKLERFFCTHTSIPESFLLKVFELLGDNKSKEEYLEKYTNDINYLEGFEVDIKKYPNKKEPDIVITYDLGEKKNSINVPLGLIEKMIEE
jgi:hypothetical protein